MQALLTVFLNDVTPLKLAIVEENRKFHFDRSLADPSLALFLSLPLLAVSPHISAKC